MNIENVKRNEIKGEKRSIQINLRITPTVSEWMTKHNVSPSKLFNEAVRELMGKVK